MIYEIKNFNEANGDATVLFDNKYLILVNIPVVDGKFLTGTDLDAHIARYEPVQKKHQEAQARIANNARDIDNMVVPFAEATAPTIDQSVIDALSDIMSIREEVISAGIFYNGFIYATDLMARLLITQAIVTLQATDYTSTIDWDDIEGITHQLTLEDLVNISALIMNNMITEYSDTRAISSQIKNAKSKEEVDALMDSHKQAKGITA